jgi:hypothetical protein
VGIHSNLVPFVSLLDGLFGYGLRVMFLPLVWLS